MQKIDDIFDDCDLDNLDVLKQEVQLLHKIANNSVDSKKGSQVHFLKIKNCFQLKRNQTAARLINSIRILLKLNGDFEAFSELLVSNL